MGNIAKWIKEISDGEDIEAVVIGKHDRNSLRDEYPFNAAPIGVVLSWEDAEPFLSYEYDSGIGGEDCHPVFAWTATKIITITEYDGATGPAWFPRHPIAISPGFDGAAEEDTHMDDDWFDDALSEGPRADESDDEECPICGDDIGPSCPCMN